PKLPVPISVDTTRPGPARAALNAGARIINDVSGLRDPALAALAAQRAEGVILMASPEAGKGRLAAAGGAVGIEATRSRRGATAPAGRGGPPPPRSRGRVPRGRLDPDRARRHREPPSEGDTPVAAVRALLRTAMGRAMAAGIPDERIVLDPGIGFFRNEAVPWDEWEAGGLAGVGEAATPGGHLR